MLTTGSNFDAPTGALFFESDGSVFLHVADGATEEDKEAIMLASDFFQYALEREDWLKEFADYIMSETGELKPSTSAHDGALKRKLTRNDLFVIRGGAPEEVN